MSAPTSIGDVRILVVGDANVGKTSIIMSLVNDCFIEDVPEKVERVVIPPDVTAERVTTAIVDYSTRVHTKEDLETELRNCNVVCIVYAVNDPASSERVSSHWLKLVQKVLGNDHDRPIILVGNKSDAIDDTELINQVVPIMNEFIEVETCVECSAKTMRNISEIFYYAQKAVVYPIRPLYSAEDKELTPKCRKALIHIFKLSDFDNDGLLSDNELNEFQTRCFDMPLSDIAIEEVKRVVTSVSSKGVLDDCLTLDGFLSLHQLFIQRGRHETTWSILKRFGYGYDLQLREDYLYPTVRIPPGSSTELSDEGICFLMGLFTKFDDDRDNCLSPTELSSLFSVCPSQPWSSEQLNSVETTSTGWVTKRGFLALWYMNTLLNINQMMEQLAYLGYNIAFRNQLSAIRVTRDRRIDVQEKYTSRRVFQCHVIGGKDAGKTVFCRSFVGKNLREVQQMNKRQMTPYVINSIKVKGQEKYLLLHEVDVFSATDSLTSYETAADVICLLYDGTASDSFAQCANIYLRYFHRTKVPVLFVATKTVGNNEVEQDFEMSPLEFCKIYGLPPPVHFPTSDIGRPSSPVYSILATMAVYPHLKHVYHYFDTKLFSLPRITFGASMALLAGFLLYKNIYV
uniref:Mitochondrial Rho GTPase n=1 Tax=Panagrellus redivivus TaxID=6233 RepID=A0A7E4ZZK7_PANRE